jgi:hypothetical protein
MEAPLNVRSPPASGALPPAIGRTAAGNRAHRRRSRALAPLARVSIMKP